MAKNRGKMLVVTALFLGSCAFVVPASVKGWALTGTADEEDLLVSAAVTQPIRQLELAPTEIAAIDRQLLVERLKVSGELQLTRRVVLRAKESGRILDVGVREGDAVKAGDVVARFETDDLQSTLKQHEGNEAALRAEALLAVQRLTRAEQLIQKNIVAREQLDKLQSDVTAATARLQSLSALTEVARAGLHEAQVLAPFDGVVSERTVDPGARVRVDASLLTIVDTTSVEAVVLVSTRDVTRVAVGQTVELRIDGPGEEAVAGYVARISPVANEGTRSVPVYIRLAGQRPLPGGMFVTGSIELRRKDDAIIVPATSLRNEDSGDYVLKLEDGHLVRQPVKVASTWNGGDSLEISGGLMRGDRIVVAPLPDLQPFVAEMIPGEG